MSQSPCCFVPQTRADSYLPLGQLLLNKRLLDFDSPRKAASCGVVSEMAIFRSDAETPARVGSPPHLPHVQALRLPYAEGDKVLCS